VHLSILKENIIIISSAQMAIDMQDSKGSIYADRHSTPMMRLVGWTNTMPFSNPGPFFRQQRGYMHRLFGTQAALSRQHIIMESEGHRFLQQVLSSPENLANRVRQYVVILRHVSHLSVII
jgi:hypothetical protein